MRRGGAPGAVRPPPRPLRLLLHVFKDAQVPFVLNLCVFLVVKVSSSAKSPQPSCPRMITHTGSFPFEELRSTLLTEL